MRGHTSANSTASHAQHLLFAAICDPEPVSEAAQALITDHPPLTAKARLELYAEMYWLRMRDALRGSFPTVHSALGDAEFDALVADFLREHPSTHHSLDRLGVPFAGFLQTARPEWADVAALEWARAESFIALDGPVVAFTELQSIPPEAWADVSLQAHPSVRVLELARDPQPSVRAQRDAAAIPEAPLTPTALVVWRAGFTVFHAQVSPREAAALRALAARAPLPELLAPFEDVDDGGVTAFEALRSWFSEGMIAEVGSAPPRDDERAH